jgi:hypothetical protein
VNKKISIALSFALLILCWSVPCPADNLYAVSHAAIAGGSENSLLSSHSTAIKAPADSGSMDQQGFASEGLLQSSQAPGLISALDDSALYCDSGGEFIQADRMIWKDPLSAHSFPFFSRTTFPFFTVSNTSEPGQPLMPLELVLLGIALFGLAGYGGRKTFRR